MPQPRRRIALRLQYDGSTFAGSQRQRGPATVQEALEAAAVALTGLPHRVDFAGRTDAGVHATGQVAALTTTSSIPPERWLGGLNHSLPAAVAVQAAREVPLDFDPRRSARDRTYCYSVRVSPVRQPLWERRVWVLPRPPALAAVREALEKLVGEHDFAAFSGRPPPSGTVRRMLEARVDGERKELRFLFRAQSFLPQQVRRTVGQVVRIGQGAATPALIDELLETPQGAAAGPAAPPQGLVLVHVRYTLAELADWEECSENLCRSQG